jgi:methyltransferase, FkbM family
MNKKNLIETIVLKENVKLSGYQGEYVFEKIKNGQCFYEQLILDKWVLPNVDNYKIIYDVGANIGNHTTYFAHNIKKANIFSFEPIKENYNLLKKNISDNNFNNVKLFEFALGSHNTRAHMEFMEENNNGTSTIVLDSVSGEEVIVKVTDELELPLPNFVKIDVEGFEYEVLKGMRETLIKSKPDLWVEVDEKNSIEVVKFLSEIGYGIEDYVLQASNNILFKNNINCDENTIKIFTSLLEESAQKRKNWIDLGKRISQFTFEQSKANNLKKELGDSQWKLKKSDEKLRQAFEQVIKLEEELNKEKGKTSQLSNRLENETKRANDNLEKLKSKTSNFEYEQKKAKDLQIKLNNLQSKLDMYNKSKLFKIMIFKWKLNTRIKFIIKNNIYSIGHFIYIKCLPYPKARAFFSRLNSKLHIFKDNQKVITYDMKKPSSKKQKDNLSGTKSPKKMNVAMIVDEFTYNSFKFECNALPIEPSNWKKIFEENCIDMFFCESAWSGTDSIKRPWKGQVYCSENFKNENRGVLLAILEYCKTNKIPTVFWNKEDPTHYPDKIHNFVDTALKFDHIFTTDRDCVEKYKEEYGHKSVHLLMFATQPRLFNPIEKYNRTDEIIFAGSWYNQHPTRCVEMGAILDNIIESQYNLKIYDRQSENSDPNHIFPERFKKYLNPCLKHDEIEIAYKSSKYALNINTVTNSDTMFARRVFELMSSNTLVLSNYSKGMQELFGEDVVFTNGEKEIDLKDADRKRMNCLYKVLKNHTYKERFRQILDECGIDYEEEDNSVTIIYRISSMSDAEKAYKHFMSINYNNKKACFFLNDKCILEDMREILVKYQNQYIYVYSETYDSKYGKNLCMDSKYFIFADTSLDLGFIDKAVLHFEYIDNNIGIVDNGNFKINSKINLNNVLFDIRQYDNVKESIKESGKEMLVYEIQ